MLPWKCTNLKAKNKGNRSFFYYSTLVFTIQLSSKSGFDNRTSKPGIFGHPTIKTVQIWPSGCFDEWFQKFYL
jgi:hypothetical protein